MDSEIKTPDWVKDAIFYQIFPDRFAASKRVRKPNNLEDWDAPPTQFGFKGGDLLGVVEHLDYLQDLGINAIYFNPIFQSASNHRYHTHDYLHVDPLLGGDEAFKTLLKEAHRREIRIVLDGVFNHASRGFFQFNHILETGENSPYLDWFDIRGFPLNAYHGEPNYRSWLGLPALPEFNTDNPMVREFIFEVARQWLETGIDGWRLDVPFEIDDDSFWQEFRQVVKRTNPEAYLVGEIATEAQRWLQGDQFDAAMNYQFTLACLGFFSGERTDRELAKGVMGLPDMSVLDAAAFSQRATELLSLYPQAIVLAQFNLLDSHDMPRFLSLARGDKDSLRLATLFQMTYPGAPCIYYGDEIGMEGGHDPDDRRAFPWDESKWEHELRDFFKQTIAMRKAHPALRGDDFVSLFAEGQVFAYLRCQGDESLVVVLNNSEQAYEMDIPAGDHLADGTIWQGLLGERNAQVKGGKLQDAKIPARTGEVFLFKIEAFA
jgi:cyclomaltodextrinase / maltogenic alpha-amylase / neopullulanase